MILRQALLGGIVAAGLAMSGAGVTAALMDIPQDAVPVTDPVGDALREKAQEAAPPATPSPTVVTPVQTPAAVDSEVGVPQEEVTEEVLEEAPVVEAPVEEEKAEPEVRSRRPVAIVQAIDKTTAQTMRFEVEVGGRPVRFSRSLIFKVRACEITGANELIEDSIAYMEIGIQPRSQTPSNEARQVFKGWMFASSPSVNGLEHPVYDAWIVGCKS